LAARAAAEIVARDQDLRLAIGRLVEDEIRVLAAVVAEALFRKQALAETGALDGLEVLLGNDRVGVDVDLLQRRRDALEHGELVHGRRPSRNIFSKTALGDSAFWFRVKSLKDRYFLYSYRKR